MNHLRQKVMCQLQSSCYLIKEIDCQLFTITSVISATNAVT